jgi:hypothetical protein
VDVAVNDRSVSTVNRRATGGRASRNQPAYPRRRGIPYP